MNVRIWIAGPDSLKTLSRILLVAVALTAFFSGYWLVKFGLASLAERNSRASAKASVGVISTTRTDLQKAQKLENAPEYNGMQPVVQLQAVVEKAASERHCELAEFQAASDVAPYLTRFEKKSDQTEWLQIEIKMSLKGQPDEIIETLRAVAEGPCLVEFNGIDLVRDETNVREGGVQAKVEMRVLTKRAEAKP